MKVCKKCHTEKDDLEFSINSTTGKLHSYCRSCYNELQRKLPSRQGSKRQYNFGMIAKDFNSLVNKQKGICPICENLLEYGNQVIDHDHKTQVIRGVLCRRCNTLLGLCRDDPQVLLRGVKYLEKHKNAKRPLLEMLMTVGTSGTINH